MSNTKKVKRNDCDLQLNEFNDETTALQTISKLILDTYIKYQNDATNFEINIFISAPNTPLFSNIHSWLLKSTIKEQFYKLSPFTPMTLYIDKATIQKFYQSNEFIEFNKTYVTAETPMLYKWALYYYSHLFKSKRTRNYIHLEFDLRKPIADIPYVKFDVPIQESSILKSESYDETREPSIVKRKVSIFGL